MGMTCNLLRVSTAELEAYQHNSALLSERLGTSASDPAYYDIDKSWDGIIYLLTGSNSSDTNQFLSKIIFSGQLIDPEQDLGTGPAHFLTQQQVHDIHEQIKHLVPSELKAKFNASAMKEQGVYPNVWEHEDAADYLTEYFETIQEIFALASAHGEAVITFIS